MKHRHATGFTLIELLAALSLAAALMVAVLGVFMSLATQWRALVNDSGSRWRQQLERQLRSDLGSSRQIRWSPTELQMFGFGSRGFESGTATLRPADIRYTVEEHGGQSWLFRTEFHRDGRTNGDARKELVCRGVSSLEVQSMEEEQALASREMATPAALRLILDGSSGDAPILDSVLVLHQEATDDDES